MQKFSFESIPKTPTDLEQFFGRFQFSPVMDWPFEYEVYDFTKGYDSQRDLKFQFGVGRYNEKRPGMYQGDLYKDQRDIHVGIDLAAPVGHELRSFYPGRVKYAAYNPQPWDYGYTLVTEHHLGGYDLFALWGHLDRKSIEKSSVGREFLHGEVLGFIGDRHENGGWNPHLHFQLSWKDPQAADLPGVVSESNRATGLKIFPDPQWVLGRLYGEI